MPLHKSNEHVNTGMFIRQDFYLHFGLPVIKFISCIGCILFQVESGTSSVGKANTESAHRFINSLGEDCSPTPYCESERI